MKSNCICNVDVNNFMSKFGSRHSHEKIKRARCGQIGTNPGVKNVFQGSAFVQASLLPDKNAGAGFPSRVLFFSSEKSIYDFIYV